MFSHGILLHRTAYSCIFRELASCGFCVISVTHGDGTADFHPKFRFFPTDFKMFDYNARNKEAAIRDEEMNQIIAEALTPGAFNHFGKDWEQIKFSEQVVIMGHSFGGLTAFSVA